MPLPDSLKRPLKRWLGPVVFPIQRAWNQRKEEQAVQAMLSQIEPCPWQVGEKLLVSYAHPAFPGPLPGPCQYIHGGAVKYTYLREVFGDAGPRFHLLYGVSSGHAPGMNALAQAVQARGARLVWNQNGVHHPQNYPNAAELNAKTAEVYRRADYVLYQSQFCRQAAERFLGQRNGPGEILYNAIDTQFFTPRTVEPRPAELRLLMGGSHYSDYRLPAAIRALAAVRRQRPARLLISGAISGSYETAARGLVADLGLDPYVEFLGPYTQTEAPAIYRRGDIYVHTKYLDPCPSAVIEAMACGLPVVYSATGGTPELVGPLAGAGAEAETRWDRDLPPDPEQLARLILQVAEHLDDVSLAARQRAVECFDLKPWLARHQELFKSLF